VSRNPLVIDAAVAVVIVALVLILEPGVAVAAILALILLVVCGVSYLVARRPRRRAPAGPSARSRRR
jgi:Flp pilus assembly protein TadB